MKRIIQISLFLFTVALLTACTITRRGAVAPMAPPAPTPTPGADSSFLGRDWVTPYTYAPGLVSTQSYRFGAIPGATIYHMDWVLSPNLRTLGAVVEIRYTNRESTALNEIILRLYPNLMGAPITLLAAKVDGKPVVAALSHEDSVLTMPLDAPLIPGGQVTLRLEYTLAIPLGANRNYGVLSHAARVTSLPHAYPIISTYDENGWNSDIPVAWGDLTYNEASYYIVRVTAPSSVALVASGIEIKQDVNPDNNTQTITFAVGPARDFTLVALEGYQKTTHLLNETSLNVYALPENQEYASLALRTATEALRTYNDLYTPYPYTELDIVATPTLALGVEYPGLVVINERLYTPQANANPPTRLALEYTIAHEVAHQWFYNLIGNNQSSEPWLDEGFSQYATWQYLNAEYGKGGASLYKEGLNTRWNRVEKATIPVGLPASAYTENQYSAIVYGRGALFFFALQERIGERSFNKFIKDYTRNNMWGISTSLSFKQTAERACSCNLDGLFGQWVFPTPLPTSSPSPTP